MLSKKRPLSPSGEPTEHTSKKPEHVTRSSTTTSPPTKSLKGIVLRTIQRTENLQAMATELCKSDDLTIDTSKSRIGNPEGHALLSRLDSIANDIKDLQGRATRSERLLERSDRLLDSLLVVRHGVLDEWAGQPRVQDEVQERNGVAHGGCIIMDIEVILSMFQDEPERATRWEEAFLTHYGVSWQKVASSKNDLKAGSRMAKIFDIYADSKSLHRYQKGHNTQRKDEVVRLCEEWIAKWKSDPTIKITPEDFEHILALDRNVY